ncbi:hypothetical protein WA1_19130 [Scytonema hofmannii PCC 7110]|uniref:Transposase IS701-like DDE domain-containing protein n=1 Tax=Scytonema hofmannii PCC 7110 TaxID=128403 RepID=A0A139XBU4_9CYAN|nr:hypothetical protein WA1_19130 [Scytonema hofmannii PCC 7110]
MLSDIKRKTLPSIAKVVGLDNHQPLHHFLTESPWNTKELRKQRLEFILYPPFRTPYCHNRFSRMFTNDKSFILYKDGEIIDGDTYGKLR